VATKKPVGTITRGTTNPNRLRRIDRYIAALPILRSTDAPVVVDLGFGASPITAIELLDRVSKVNPNAHVVGIEIDRERVERGLAVASQQLHFTHGGFEVPLPTALDAGGATVIRAFNVLRQYSEPEVPAAWRSMQSRLATNGLLVEGTCDEIGRLASWVTINRAEPISFTISLRLAGLELPSKVAERLPKALIHRNVPGERIHNFLTALDRAWLTNAGVGAFSPSQRWQATCAQLENDGWPIIGDRKRRRLGELSIAWDAVRPT
jgi:hypothetical protein